MTDEREWLHVDEGDKLDGFEHPAAFAFDVLRGGPGGMGEGWELQAVVMEEASPGGGTHAWAVLQAEPHGDTMFYEGWNAASSLDAAKGAAEASLRAATAQEW